MLKALRVQAPQGVLLQAWGTGGPLLIRAGLEAQVDSRKLLVMGFVEILSRFFVFKKALKTLESQAQERQPDLAIVVDYPDFHFRLVRRLKKFGIPVFYYIPPKVWVWRKKRIFKIRDWFEKVFCIFPFEEKFYQQHGVSVQYVGNPLIDELPLQRSKAEARKILGLSPTSQVVTLMPGSRPAEIKQHLEVMLLGVVSYLQSQKQRMSALQEESLEVLIPLAETTDSHFVDLLFHEIQNKNPVLHDFIAQNSIRIHWLVGQAMESLKASDAGLIKSGTSTLEAALLGCPHAVVYRTHWTTAWIFKFLIRYHGPVSLVNLVAGGGPDTKERLVDEILLAEVTPPRLSQALVQLLNHPENQNKIKDGFSRLSEALQVNGESPSHRVARECWAFLNHKQKVKSYGDIQ